MHETSLIWNLRILEREGYEVIEASQGGEAHDIYLEHADRISVPSRPGFVTVAGAARSGVAAAELLAAVRQAHIV